MNNLLTQNQAEATARKMCKMYSKPEIAQELRQFSLNELKLIKSYLIRLPANVTPLFDDSDYTYDEMLNRLSSIVADF